MSIMIMCPNGRRQAMKVTPNTTILEILEYVCEKQGFDPKEYELTRNNKALDLSLNIRFANIPNNGQLDLKKSNSVRKDRKVTIAVDLEDGMRQINEFDSDQNLWQIIHSLFENNPILNLEPNMQFSIIYIQKEITGENQLKQTNLKSLGLVQGKAAMKLLTRPIDAPKGQAYVESLDLTRNVKESEVKTHIQTDSQRTKGTTNVTQIEANVELRQQTNPSQSHTIKTSESNAELSNTTSNQETEQKSDDTQQMDISSEEESDDQTEEMLNFLGGNHSEILFKISDLPKVSKKDFSDDFYETTKDDLLHVLSDLRQQQTAGKNKPLETKQMKEQKRKEQMNRYKSTVIRVCFPNDKLVFQAIFKPTDSVENVKSIIRHYISSNDFYLYTVPPKRILKSESSLFDSELVPAALIHFGLNSSETHQNVIKEEFKSKLSSYKSAAKIANEVRSGGKPTDSTPIQHTSQTHNRTDSEKRGPNPKQNEPKVPKWFKTNK